MEHVEGFHFPPNWFRCRGVLVRSAGSEKWLAKNGFASNASLRKYSHALPCHWLAPDLVTKFVMAPALLPNSAELFSVSNWNSCTVSWMGWLTAPPLKPLLETPFSRNPLKFSRTPFTTVFAPFSRMAPRTLVATSAY